MTNSVFSISGEYLRTIHCLQSDLPLNVAANETAVAGDWSGHYLDAANQLQPIPEIPPYCHWQSETRTVSPPDLERAHADMWQKIRAERVRRTESGGFKVGAHWFHSDPHSRTQQVALVSAAMLVLQQGGTNDTPIPGVTAWSTLSGAKVTMTAGLAIQVLQSASVMESVTFEAAEAHRNAMQASAEPWAYDYSGGWPQTFEEWRDATGPA